MKILEAFDKALAADESVRRSVKNIYTVSSSGKKYEQYLSNADWKALKANMDSAHEKQFSAGGGKELDEKDGKPPKMAAFASSSRMIYEHSKKVPGFVFEKKLTTTIGGVANLDGYLNLPHKQIFVEAKCREPYGHKAEQVIKQNYREVYEYLQEKMSGNFSCEMEIVPEKEGDNEKAKRNMRVKFYCNGNIVAFFDIKQMICHLLSVATEGLKNRENKERVFLYFLYNPSVLQIPVAEKNEIMRIYNDTCWTANQYDFKKMFGHIVDFINEKKNFCEDSAYISGLKNSFTFLLCDQDTYNSHL